MKNKKFKKILSLSLAVAMIFGLLSFTAAAALDENASAFNQAVAAIENASNLSTKELKLNEADAALEAYINAGGDPTDAVVSEAYARYLPLKSDITEKVGYCQEFINCVSAALEENCTYPDKRANLDRAAELLDKIDPAYSVVSEYKDYYSTVCAELIEPIEICEAFIAYAEAAANSTTYADAKKNIRNAEAAKNQITILDYPGLEEAESKLVTANMMMSMAVLKAKPFIQAVRDIYKAETVPLGVLAAYNALEGIDKTAEGVSTAMDNLKKAEGSYNRSASAANNAIDEITLLTLGILF